MDQPFDAAELERRLALLSKLPGSLYAATVTNPDGELLARVRGLLSWRQALLQGRLPSENAEWPSPAILHALLDELKRLNIARFCKDQVELTDTLLGDILQAVERYALALEARTRDLFEEMRRLEQLRREQARRVEERRQEEEAQRRASERGPAGHPGVAETRGPMVGSHEGEGVGDTTASESGVEVPGSEIGGESAVLPELDPETINQLRKEAGRLAREKVANETADGLHSEWAERARIWAELSDVFGELAELLGRGWDFCRGILRSAGWLELVRLQKLLERLPALREIIRSLGRLHARPDQPDELPVAERVFRHIRRAEEEQREVRSPLAPTETRGVTRSDDLTRMLPSEAAMLGHRVLRRLWHARRAEHTLVTYRVEGVLADHSITEQDSEEEVEAPPPPKVERGPILVCVDTSGSMNGTPETVAKAITLEAVRVAHAEKRGCHLYLFSGPGDVAEHTLSLTPEGLAKLLAFLTLTFGGGTDVSGPLRRAVARLDDAEWQRADILILSDGEFPVPDETVEILRDARENRGLRIHGVLIGSARRESMEALCDHLHVFMDWEAMVSPPVAP